MRRGGDYKKRRGLTRRYVGDASRLDASEAASDGREAEIVGHLLRLELAWRLKRTDEAEAGSGGKMRENTAPSPSQTSTNVRLHQCSRR